MPVRVVSTGLPQVRVEDSSPVLSGLGRATETLLSTVPQVMQIRAQRDQQQRENAMREQTLNMNRDQQEMENRLRNRQLNIESDRNRLAAEQHGAQIKAMADWREQQAAASKAAQEREDAQAMAEGKMDIPEHQKYVPAIGGAMRSLSGLPSMLGGDTMVQGLSGLGQSLGEAGKSQIAKSADLANAKRQAEINKLNAQADGTDSSWRQTAKERDLYSLRKMIDSEGFMMLPKNQQAELISRHNQLQSMIDAERGVQPTAQPATPNDPWSGLNAYKRQ